MSGTIKQSLGFILSIIDESRLMEYVNFTRFFMFKKWKSIQMIWDAVCGNVPTVHNEDIRGPE